MDPIRFRDCACPGDPHPEGDTITFRPRLSFDANIRALRAILTDPDNMASAAWNVYVSQGPLEWNLLDADGQPLALNQAAIDDLPFVDQYQIANLADSVYGGQVIAPLVEMKKKSSKTTRTPASSRRPRSSSSRTREPRAQS